MGAAVLVRTSQDCYTLYSGTTVCSMSRARHWYSIYHLKYASTVRVLAQVIVILVVFEYVHSWFRTHDEEAASVSERVFERPLQPEKVQKATVVS